VNEPERAPLWRLLAATGLRRGEVLGLEWRDVKGAVLSVERNATPSGPLGLPKVGPLKNRKSRAVALDEATVKLLKVWKAHRGSLALQLVQPDAPIFASENGYRALPKAETKTFGGAVHRWRRDLGDAAPPVITLHGLRHTAITHWLEAAVPVKTVAERHGHSVQVMLATYAHVLAGSQATAAQQVADLMALRAAQAA
jgi:integrase